MQQSILLLFLTLSTQFSFSQFEYHKTFGGDNKDVAYSTCKSTEGNVVILGLSASFGNSKEIIAINVNPDGSVLWSKAYGGEKADIASKIKPTADGGYIVVGTTSSFNVTRRDVYLIKLASNGDVQWSKTYGGKYIEYGFDVEVCSDGGYIVVGETNSFDAQNSDLLVIKVTVSGDLEWGHIYGDRHIEFGQAVHQLDDGYIIAGETNSFSQDTIGNKEGVNDIFLMKIDFNGEVIWSNIYGGNDDDFISDMIVDVDYGFFILGNTLSFGMGNRDGLMIRTDNEGKIIQAKTLGNEGNDQLQTVNRVGENDGYIITGMSNSHNDQLKKQDALLIRLNKKGSFKWSKTFGGEEDDMGLSAFVNSENHIIMAGGTESFNHLTRQDIYVLQLPDERKMQNCELSTVQVVSIPLKEEEINTEEVGLSHKPVTPTVTVVETLVRDIELTESVLCAADKILLDGIKIEKVEPVKSDTSIDEVEK